MRQLVTEALGTGFLLATVVDSGSMTDSFSEIQPGDAPAFIGALAATLFFGWLYKERPAKS